MEAEKTPPKSGWIKAVTLTDDCMAEVKVLTTAGNTITYLVSTIPLVTSSPTTARIQESTPRTEAEEPAKK